MSELENLCLALDAIDHEILLMAQELRGRAQALQAASARAAVEARATQSGTSLVQVANAFAAAARLCGQASASLVGASREGQSFIRRTVGGGSAHGEGPAGSAAGDPTGADPTSPAGPAGTGHAPGPGSGGRYVRPDESDVAAFAERVATVGAHNPSEWIGLGNRPRYDAGEEWQNNCGPCSRSFADAYQGVGAEPALGTAFGEGAEMWAALGVAPPAGLRNDGSSTPADFTDRAYARLADALRSAPAGTAVIVGVDWYYEEVVGDVPTGHWFNAFVDDHGQLLWADEQTGELGPWPPDFPVPIWNMDAVMRENGGAQWTAVTL